MSESRSESETCPDAAVQALRGWLFFRHEEDRHLWCAVVHGHVLPGFLLAGAWRPLTRESAARCIGTFRQARARDGVDLNGFYLFHAFGSVRAPRSEMPAVPGDPWEQSRAAWSDWPCLMAA
jgi:hypothetical protein